MKKIQKPTVTIQRLLSNQDNTENLKEWIEILKSPFKNKKFAKGSFSLVSVFEEEGRDLLDDEIDLVKVFFPSTVSKLYYEEAGNDNFEGVITLSIENGAHISFLSDTHSVSKHQKLYSEKNGIEGTWEEMVKVYLEYVQELMAVPKKK